MYSHFIIARHWVDIGIWKFSSEIAKIRLYYRVNINSVDGDEGCQGIISHGAGLVCPKHSGLSTTGDKSSWWRHQMETFSALLALCAGNSPVPGEFPSQRPVTQGFDVAFDLRLNTRLCKQSWGWWFETPSRPLWRHRNVWLVGWMVGQWDDLEFGSFRYIT